jgi:hypothetical protein
MAGRAAARKEARIADGPGRGSGSRKIASWCGGRLGNGEPRGGKGRELF